MKAYFLIPLLLVMACSKNGVSEQPNNTRDNLKNVPQNTIGFLEWNTKSEAYQKLINSKWSKPIDEDLKPLLTYIKQAFIGAFDPEFDFNYGKSNNYSHDDVIKDADIVIKNALKKGKQLGFFANNTTPPQIQNGVISYEINDRDLPAFSLIANGNELPSIVQELKTLSEDIFAGTKFATTKYNIKPKISEKDFGKIKGYQIENQINVATSNDILAVSSEEVIVQNSLTGTNNTTIFERPAYKELSNLVELDKTWLSAYYDFELATAKSVENKKNKLANSKQGDISFNYGKRALEDIERSSKINPLQALMFASKMDDTPSSTFALLFKESSDPNINQYLKKITSKSSHNILKKLPADISSFINIDGALISLIRDIAQKQNNPASAMYLNMLQPLIDNTQSLTLVSKLIPNKEPDFLVILENNNKSSINNILTLAKTYTAMLFPNLKETIENGNKVFYLKEKSGMQHKVAAITQDGIYISNSEKLLNDTLSSQDPLRAKLSKAAYNQIMQNNDQIITMYVNALSSELSSLMKTVYNQRTINQFNLANDYLTSLHDTLVTISFDGRILKLQSASTDK